MNVGIKMGDIGMEEPTAIEQHAIPQPQRDFLWAYTEEPHKSRRSEIIKAHPEVCHIRSHTLGESWEGLAAS